MTTSLDDTLTTVVADAILPIDETLREARIERNMVAMCCGLRGCIIARFGGLSLCHKGFHRARATVCALAEEEFERGRK